MRLAEDWRAKRRQAMKGDKQLITVVEGTAFWPRKMIKKAKADDSLLHFAATRCMDSTAEETLDYCGSAQEVGEYTIRVVVEAIERP
jgi:hypothetical protein